MKRVALILLILIAPTLAALAGASESTKLSKLLVGHWETNSQPPRFPTYLADGTWTLMYLGSPSVQTGKWRIEGKTLIRSYDNAEVRRSEILKLGGSEMILRTLGQVDHYKRLTKSSTVTVPASAVRVTPPDPSPATAPPGIWITGEVFSENGVLLLAICWFANARRPSLTNCTPAFRSCRKCQ